MKTRETRIETLNQQWRTSTRWRGIKRGYEAAEVVSLAGRCRLTIHWLEGAPNVFGGCCRKNLSLTA